ncbi:cytidylyltransferase domain-containing protein [Lysinibacillus fusiformis]|uniref:Spore coat polysaccharide biosynthesis protein SpsF n=1 Tax=Lysinibacillus fusiformis TaxID=28031 RepID=A0A1H9M0M1_9BACI|nr:glycosyltransferase family protein [Lysinibacillus fusiformis]SCY58371.1 spore coat polysaccharide biosynthesis protein SpsF [Lysinibacillus fusiformis]SEO15958.1 spore coat polysaccharide biosynthesis protein SpsF [Lysinibacillus fusiformis]SER17220.1 spore coat polysaccharide biosynthesis protein SpsF [Lysinibacillus fusiformis]
MNIVAITQSRMGSTRLPGKVLKKVNKKTLLDYQLDSLQKSKLLTQVVVATTTESSDDAIVKFCEKRHQAYFRGSENNVLERYYLTAKQYKADVVVRITSDCPVIDVEIVDHVIQQFINHQVDYASNTLERTYPRGMDTEVFSMKALEKAYAGASEQKELEHVTPFIYFRPQLFKLLSIKNDINYSKYRWTVDTDEDFKLIENLIGFLSLQSKEINLHNLLTAMDRHEDWYDINAHIEQKKL